MNNKTLLSLYGLITIPSFYIWGKKNLVTFNIISMTGLVLLLFINNYKSL